MTEQFSILEREDFQNLIDVLSADGYRVIGPTLGEGAVVYDDLISVGQMPVGWTDIQEGGRYRLEKRDDDALFGYHNSPQSWKRYLHPPSVRLWKAQHTDDGFTVHHEPVEAPRMAFIGVRSCDLHAIAIQDKVFMQSGYVDPTYQSRREKIFIVAVNCGQAGGTCFCMSMNTGPKADAGFDLALTEIVESRQHYFVVEVGSEKGQDILQQIPHRPAKDSEVKAAENLLKKVSKQMGRTLETDQMREILFRNYENARWDNVANRCMACANCTMVCPTCFCTTVQDVTDLSGGTAERVRQWDSCFTMDFSYIHGGSIRYSQKSRYRQWMTHKLATWFDQFGSAGCVGCGRCITWCPVGIDITEEMAAIRESEAVVPKVGGKPTHA
ncbi:MAG: 4Fe-4S dicluster domain-containing protein [Anaerolineae bacterium]|nr:4Fe-4S dicluster domain-containing protein [Anaerolineae bacterium]